MNRESAKADKTIIIKIKKKALKDVYRHMKGDFSPELGFQYLITHRDLNNTIEEFLEDPIKKELVIEIEPDGEVITAAAYEGCWNYYFKYIPFSFQQFIEDFAEYVKDYVESAAWWWGKPNIIIKVGRKEVST